MTNDSNGIDSSDILYDGVQYAIDEELQKSLDELACDFSFLTFEFKELNKENGRNDEINVATSLNTSIEYGENGTMVSSKVILLKDALDIQVFENNIKNEHNNAEKYRE